MTRFDPFAGAAPRWSAIPAHRPFLEDLAAGVLDWLGDAPPETLSDAVILLPNRRAARAFTAALAEQGGDRPMLLPQVRPLGDLEEDEPPFSPGTLGLDLPPAIAPLTRRFEMARMVARFRPDLPALRALEMADALGRFLDSCQLEELDDLSGVATLVEGELARHWEDSAAFLELAVEAWPRRLAALGLVDPAWRRARLLRLLADSWAAAPPQHPVIAAGSTGTAPAAADVLEAVARAPQGCVVLPGLDHDLDASVWATLGQNEQHPQNALWRLLARHAVAREAVRPWFRPPVEHIAHARGRARQRVLNEALRPADATSDWRVAIRDLRAAARASGVAADPIAEGLSGLSVFTVRAEEDAAATLALMMRETLETPGRTCALVTPDLALGRRVAARLERWGITADVSSGQPLARMPAGRLVDLCARFLADPLDPQTLLGLLKHPAARLDEHGGERAVGALERHALRGPRRRDWAGARRALLEAAQPRDDGRLASDHTRDEVRRANELLTRLEALSAEARAPFSGGAVAPDLAARALTGLIEALAGREAWAGPDGEAASVLLSALIEGGGSLGPLGLGEFAELVRALLTEETVRTGGANQPRLRILGAIEARLVRADRMILAGLEEGVWPNAAPTDPFLSRPMRQKLGLPPPERRLGQTAQDFVQAACAEDAILVHSERRGGQPAVKSRWLWRLEMLARGADTEATQVRLERPERPLHLARALDAPVRATPDYARRPAPRPPVARRPRQLPVTGVERWVRDPYAIYARYVLKLSPLDRPGQSAEAIARGKAVHRAVERLTLSWPDVLPEDCEGEIGRLLREELTRHGFEDAAMARETPLARNCARWLAGFETRRRARGIEIRVEETVTLTFDAPYAPFTVTAKADRIELSGSGAAVLDFKTGAIPSAKQVKSGFAPQLTLTGAILAEVGLSDTGPVEPEELTYVRVVGRKVPGESATRASGAEAAALSRAALEGLKARVARFDLETTPYLSWVAPQFMGNFGGNYDHLARVWEWHVVGGEDAEA